MKRALAGEHISHQAHTDIVEALNARLLTKTSIHYPWPMDAPSEQDLRVGEGKFQAFIRTNLYDEAAQLAEVMFAKCRRSKAFLAAGHWADHAAGIYSLQGKLRSSLRLLDDCFDALGRAQKHEGSSVELGLLSLRANFQRAMTREYKALGDFRKAKDLFRSLDADVDDLMRRGVPERYQDELAARKLHHKRQQAEMLRLMGHYRASLELMRDVTSEYPAWADEARRQGRLHQADSLRLLGKTEEALGIYNELEATAKNRHLDGLLGSVLWTKIGAIQTCAKSPEQEHELERALADLRSLVSMDGNQYGYLVVYAKLVSVSSNMAHLESADRLVREAIQAGPLESDCFRTEYAHAMLCLGEIERARRNHKRAVESYEEAFRLYERMEMRWGIVRSLCGLHIEGVSRPLPHRLQIEGCDATIWADLLDGRELSPGTLCENIP